MNADVAQRLIALNRQFYTDFGKSFSATRGRVQPGVRRVLDSLNGDESILDLGCGNGELARTLAQRGHHGSYLGLDFSLQLLSDVKFLPEGFRAEFREADLTSHWDVIARSGATKQSHGAGEHEIATTPSVPHASSRQGNDRFDLTFAFAVLHHIPSQRIRSDILKKVHELLSENGRFIHSNWQFLKSPRLRSRIRSWGEAGLTEADIDPGDYLLDWRAGGEGLRYVHHFSEGELSGLARSSGFQVVETFYSDGKEGNLSLYQTWQKG